MLSRNGIEANHLTAGFDPGCVKTQIRHRHDDTRPFRSLAMAFLEVGNGKGTPENTPIARFHTAWTQSSHCHTVLYAKSTTSQRFECRQDHSLR
jgi:hypothetical protein